MFVTYRLADSVPVASVKMYKEAILEWKNNHPLVLTMQQAEELENLKIRKVNELLDQCLGQCILKQPEVRQIVSDSLHYNDHHHYHLHDYVIMPNHVHLLIEPIDEYILQDILANHKAFTAHAINKLLGRKGPVWQRESYDRIIRNEENYWNVANYIARNPRHFGESDFTLYLTNGRPDYQAIANYIK